MNKASKVSPELNNNIRMKQVAKIMVCYLIDEGLLDIENGEVEAIIKKTLKKSRLHQAAPTPQETNKAQHL